MDQEDRNRFLELARDLRLIFLRNGASSVRLYENLAERSIFRLEMVVMTWREHELMYRHFTKPEREILDRLLRLHAGKEAPIYHYALITKQILVHK